MRQLRNLLSHLKGFGIALSLLFVLGLAVSCGGGGGGGDGGGGDGNTGNHLGFNGIVGDDDIALEADVLSPSPLDVTTFTIEAWVFPTDDRAVMVVAADSAYDLVIYPGDFSLSNILLTLYTADGSGYVRTFSGGSKPVKFNQWNHVVAMVDGTNQTVRLGSNGELSTPTSFTQTLGIGLSRRFSVGNNFSSLADFGGRVDEVRLSNVARYAANFTPEPVFSPDANTLGLWHFDEAPGSTSFGDSSGNGHALTGLNGAATVAGARP